MLPSLEEAIKVIKAGDKETGRQMLADILQADLENELAWLWLSGVVESDEEKQKYLERVLEINPDNKAARRGLALLAEKPASPPETPVPAQTGLCRSRNQRCCPSRKTVKGVPSSMVS